MYHVAASHTVVIEQKGFWIFRHWNIWDTRDPSFVLDCWSKEEVGAVARSIAGDTGDISVVENGVLHRVVEVVL